jgi:hypothetical protein
MKPSIVTRSAIVAVLFTWSSSAWSAPVPQARGGGVMPALVIGIADDGGAQKDDKTPGPAMAQATQTQPGAGAQQQPDQASQPQPAADAQVEPVRVSIANGSPDLFWSIEKGRAPFVPAEPSDADIVWDVGNGTALSRGDLIMEKVDGSVLGDVIDRTWAVREIRKLASPRIIDVMMGEHGKTYAPGDQPTLVADGIGGSYLTVVNVASDGTLQLLFPVYASHDPHMSADKWTYSPKVDPPLGADYTVVIATSAPADDLIGWLRAHNQKHDAFELPAVLDSKIKTDSKTRLGSAGLFTR